jgi:hypothetical protein
MKLNFDYLGDDLIYRYQAPSVSPNTWVRPTGWLTLPTITSADTKIAGLVAVYENNENCISIQSQAGTSQNYNIDWGDGTSQTGTSTNVQTKRYDYASLSSIILQDAFGYNYKQALIIITNNSGTVTFWQLSPTTTQSGPPNWLDVSYSWASNISFGSGRAPYLQRLQIFKATISGNNNSYMTSLVSLRSLRWDNVTSTGVSQCLNYMNYLGNIDKMDFTFNTSAGIAADYFLYINSVRAFGNISIPNASTLSNFMGGSQAEEIGNIDITSATNISQAFLSCNSLVKIGIITAPAATNITSVFNNCPKLREIVFTSCAAVTTTTTAFSSCLSLEKLRMPGIAATFSISGCNLQRPALVTLFGDLATVTAKTITITNNPGVADLTAADLLIATAKGWTVTQ